MGASVRNIAALLSKDFMKLVSISILLASPLAWFAMNKWLQDYDYRINISWFVLIISGLLAIVIANPVKSLRTE